MAARPEDIRVSTQHILESFSVEKQDFGVHWKGIKAKRYEGSMSDDQFDKLCKFLVVATRKCGLTANSIPKHYLKQPLEWRFKSVKKKTMRLCAKVRRRLAKRQKVTEYYPATEQEAGQDAAVRPQDPESESTWEGFSPEPQPIGPKNPPKVVVGENALDGYNAISCSSWLGPEDMRLREKPSKNQRQMLMDFPHGQQFFPLDLIEASAEQRHNWHETVVCFDKAASEAQIPLSIPEPYRTSCIEKVPACNPRLTPSQQDCNKNIDLAKKQKRPIYLADLVAILCFVHYKVGESGRNSWLWKKLKAQRLLQPLEYSFNWANIKDGVIYDSKGRSMAKKITLETPPDRLHRAKRLPFGAKKDRAKF